ncbi:hypothetical protein [Streptomyces cacaoi]|uniref:hypothetical protein n=1 Tax=Streptomyces cacaoi TaxID=1898 RepID=UPI003749B700
MQRFADLFITRFRHVEGIVNLERRKISCATLGAPSSDEQRTGGVSVLWSEITRMLAWPTRVAKTRVSLPGSIGEEVGRVR